MIDDILSSITKSINSPPAQLAAGAVLAGIVWKFFERVESVLTDLTKLEIAVWLVGIKTSNKIESWPNTFVTMFDHVFGSKHLSLKCFWKSCLASYALVAVAVLISVTSMPIPIAPSLGRAFLLVLAEAAIPTLLWASIVGNVLPDFLSLLATRTALRFISKTSTVKWSLFILAVDLLITVCLAIIAAKLAYWVTVDLRFWRGSAEVQALHAAHPDMSVNDFAMMTGLRPEIRGLFATVFISQNALLLWIFPAFFTSIWLWLYVGSGLILRAARRFDVGFDWFNRKFDIEKKPLQAIGLVAGSIVSVVYWIAIATRHFL